MHLIRQPLIIEQNTVLMKISSILLLYFIMEYNNNNESNNLLSSLKSKLLMIDFCKEKKTKREKLHSWF